MRLLLLLVATFVTLACGDKQSERCRDVCQKEVDCSENRIRPEENFPYDFDECVAACVSLERDTASKPMVDKHVECANKAGDDCQALMECRR